MSHRFAFPLAIASCLASPMSAFAADFTFCWNGASGYTMVGKMQLSEGVTGIATQEDVVSFKIAGYRDGALVGTWDMRDLRDGATWHLRFDVATQSFPTGGDFPTSHSQGWNANGGVTDCGNPGFGFNSGSYAQDVCINGSWVRDSSIPPGTPLYAVAGTSVPQCQQQILMSKLPKTNHSD